MDKVRYLLTSVSADGTKVDESWHVSKEVAFRVARAMTKPGSLSLEKGEKVVIQLVETVCELTKEEE